MYRNAVFAERRSDLCQNSGFVRNGHSDVIFAFEIDGEVFVGNDGIIAEQPVFILYRGIDYIRNDRGTRRQVARAPAVQHNVAHVVAVYKNGVERTFDGSQRIVVRYKCGVYARFDLSVDFSADRQKF